MTAFRKYHGLGNDFVLIDNRHTAAPVLTPSEAEAVCNRNTGVGADGVIFLLPPTKSTSDFGMRLYNSDGTEPEMCGNGIRCLARFAADLGVHGRSSGRYVVDTGAGEIIPQMERGSEQVKVDMGAPILEPKLVPTMLETCAANEYQDVLKALAGRDWTFSCVSMGNPHAITFVTKEVYDDIDARLEAVGPTFENHPVFPQRTNTEFVYQHSKTEFDMLVWERGAGRTMACGTGACAVLVAAVITGRAEKDVPTVIRLPGGDLTIEWESSSNHVLMTGPAQLVFEGKLANI
ncbi:Diaminopimelate epimerase [Gracilaria domingensis]|nr:Diaminopimelate epimerase [Gracilaria domingensis]